MIDHFNAGKSPTQAPLWSMLLKTSVTYMSKWCPNAQARKYFTIYNLLSDSQTPCRLLLSTHKKQLVSSRFINSGARRNHQYLDTIGIQYTIRFVEPKLSGTSKKTPAMLGQTSNGPFRENTDFVPVTVNLPLPTLARKRMLTNEQNNPGFGGFKARKKNLQSHWDQHPS